MARYMNATNAKINNILEEMGKIIGRHILLIYCQRPTLVLYITDWQIYRAFGVT